MQLLSHILVCSRPFAVGSPQVRCETGWARTLVRSYFYQWLLHQSKFAHWNCLTILQSLGWGARGPSGHLAQLFPEAHSYFNAAFHSRSQQSSAPAPRGSRWASCPSHPQDSGAGPWTCGNKDFAQHLPAQHLPGKGAPCFWRPIIHTPNSIADTDLPLLFLLNTFRYKRNRNETQINLIPNGNLL